MTTGEVPRTVTKIYGHGPKDDRFDNLICLYCPVRGHRASDASVHSRAENRLRPVLIID
jgi:hypothetical protein